MPVDLELHAAGRCSPGARSKLAFLAMLCSRWLEPKKKCRTLVNGHAVKQLAGVTIPLVRVSHLLDLLFWL